MASSFSSYLKRGVPYLFLGGGAATGMALMYPHTVGLESYKSLLAIHTADGKEEEVDIEIEKIAEEIKENYGWTKNPMESSETMSLFPSSSTEFCHLGTAKTSWGGHLGVPMYYLHKFQKDEKSFRDLFHSMNIDPSSTAADNIRQSFKISDDAKTFAIAREMKLCKSYQIFFIAFGAQIAMSSFFLIPNIISTMLPFPGVKFLTVLTLLPFYYYGFENFQKSSSRFIEKGADKAAASLSQQIAFAGLEYYDAMILRKNELENDVNVTSEKTDNGSFLQKLVQYSRFDSNMTLSERKENLKELIETIYNTEKKNSSS